MDQEQLNQTENNMPPKKRKSQTNAKKAIANMGANMAAMMSPTLSSSQNCLQSRLS